MMEEEEEEEVERGGADVDGCAAVMSTEDGEVVGESSINGVTSLDSSLNMSNRVFG